MFDRNRPKTTDAVDLQSELSRFDGDVYKAKHLAGVYNPEFKIYTPRLRDFPKLSETGLLLEWYSDKRKYSRAEEVF